VVLKERERDTAFTVRTTNSPSTSVSGGNCSHAPAIWGTSTNPTEKKRKIKEKRRTVCGEWKTNPLRLIVGGAVPAEIIKGSFLREDLSRHFAASSATADEPRGGQEFT
jgi:hypothetical protein